MRRGEDRQTIGALVADVLFPDDGPHLAGLPLGTPAAQAVARLGPGRVDGGATVWDHALDDPHGVGRLLQVRMQQQVGRIHRVEAKLFSGDKMDVDATWQVVKEHLDATLGKPDREVTGVLKLVWRVPAAGDGGVEARTSGSRYKDDQQRAVLDLACAVVDGVRFEGGRKG